MLADVTGGSPVVTIWWVVDLPLWKMMEFVSWDDEYAQYIYIYGKETTKFIKCHVPNHQPDPCFCFNTSGSSMTWIIWGNPEGIGNLHFTISNSCPYHTWHRHFMYGDILGECLAVIHCYCIKSLLIWPAKMWKPYDSYGLWFTWSIHVGEDRYIQPNSIFQMLKGAKQWIDLKEHLLEIMQWIGIHRRQPSKTVQNYILRGVIQSIDWFGRPSMVESRVFTSKYRVSVFLQLLPWNQFSESRNQQSEMVISDTQMLWFFWYF